MEEDISSIHCFSPQMPVRVRASQEPGTQSSFPMWVGKTQTLWESLSTFLRLQGQEGGSEAGQFGFEPGSVT